jgi:hypothetical protein
LRRSARSAFQRRLEFPNRSVARAADRIQRQTGSRFAASAHDLEPAIAAVEALRDRRRRLRRADHPKSAVCSVRSSGHYSDRRARGQGRWAGRALYILFGTPWPKRPLLQSVLTAMRGSGTILVITVLLGLLAAVGWFAWSGLAGPGEPMPPEGYVALALGALIAALAGIGLMALGFYSSRRGYDEPPHFRRDY